MSTGDGHIRYLHPSNQRCPCCGGRPANAGTSRSGRLRYYRCRSCDHRWSTMAIGEEIRAADGRHHIAPTA